MQLHFMIILLVISLSLISMPILQAETTTPKLSNKKPTIEVVDHGWSKDNFLVIGILIYAPTETSFQLRHGIDSDLEDDFSIFTTKDSYLTQKGLRKRFPSLQIIPNSPNFGRIKSSATLKPGETMRFTGAYRLRKPAPLKESSEPKDIELELHLPNKLGTVSFAIPHPKN